MFISLWICFLLCVCGVVFFLVSSPLRLVWVPNRLPTVISEEGGGSSRRRGDEVPHCAAEAREINKPGGVVITLHTSTLKKKTNSHHHHLLLLLFLLPSSRHPLVSHLHEAYLHILLIHLGDQIAESLINTRSERRTPSNKMWCKKCVSWRGHHAPV